MTFESRELSDHVIDEKKKNTEQTFYIYDEDTCSSLEVSINVETNAEEQDLELFFDDKVRKAWHKQEEEWYFSIVDVCQVLTDSIDGRKYWNKLKQRLKEEGNQTVTNCHQLKLKASDGKMRKTDCATTEELLRLIQSIPSKKAEPFKLWLAQVGKERLDEMADPELAFDRMIQLYRQKGYSEVSATALSQAKNPHGFHESKKVTQEGGNIAGNARLELEEKLGKSVISPLNAHEPSLLDDSDKNS